MCRITGNPLDKTEDISSNNNYRFYQNLEADSNCSAGSETPKLL
jgi:hypothetical protein